ncbi:MAG: cytochrome b561 [Acidimicrobiales bacterium]|nr:MAG: cytochrome b561 [Acidimicrobiales bacterium]
MTDTLEAPPGDDAAPPTTERVAVLKHRRGSRWMHWINFPLITIMIYSGLRIYKAEDIYAFGIFGWEWFHFFPDPVYDTLDLNRRLARGLAFHFNFAWLFTINGLAYAIYTWRTGEWRQLVPRRRHLKDAWHVLLHDLHLRKDPPPNRGRYNEAQRLTYSFVLLLGFLAILSGFAIFKPTQLSFLTWMLGGYETARVIHFTVTILFCLFFVVHILQVARAGFRNLMSMVTGYEIVDRKVESHD